MDINSNDIFYWCDSALALSWFLNDSKLFVTNRLVEIQELTDKYKYRHFRVRDNSADTISRGIDAEELVTSILWYHGSEWSEETSAND